MPASIARPILLPGLRRLWRSRHRIQLGADPARAIVLELSNPAVVKLLDLLDGTRSERTVLRDAARFGVPPADSRALFDALRDAGLVIGAQSLLPQNLPDPVRRRLSAEAAALALRGSNVPASPATILRRRRAARVVVTGHGRLGGPVALALAQAGVGHVCPALTGPVTPADLLLAAAPAGRDLRTAVAEAIATTAPDTRTGPVRRSDTTFVVQVGATGPATLTAAGYAGRKLAHLVVNTRDGTAVVGPLVPPGGAPCLNCVDLHRQDRDPDWPHLAAQLTQPPENEPCAAATLLAAAGLAAGEVLDWLDGATPNTLGASVELAAPGRLRRRTWSPHPRCHCGKQAPRTRPRAD